MSVEWDIEELAGYVMGKSEEEVEEMINNSDTDDKLNEKYGIDFDTYCSIVKDLLPFTPVVQAGISKNHFNAFILAKEQRMIVKQPIKIKL